MKYVISALVENHHGVLAHVAGLFSARAFNIDSLAVGETQDPTVSRMTIVADGDERVLDQIMKQLGKLIDVITVEQLAEEEAIERELVLAKVKAQSSTRADIMQIVNTFRAKIVDVNPHSITIEVTGGESKVDAMLELLQPFGLLEVVRTGLIAVSRRNELKVPPKKQARKKKAGKKSRKKVAVAK